ncbi:MAG: inositol monophosphatase family protein [Ilumatobacteraceae bacterium]
MSDAELATQLARDTGRLLVELRDRLAREGASPWHLMDAGDALAHRFIVDTLRRDRPNDAVLSEEGADDAARLSAQRVWIVDPLDGTSEFGEDGREAWAVHIALWDRQAGTGGDLVAAAVALPALDTTLSTLPPPPVPKRQDRTPLMVVSRSRTPAVAAAVARELGYDGVRLGSAGAKTMAVVLGHVDVYLHAGGQYQWDSAAPIAVARAAGLHTSRIDGSPLVYNDRDTWLPDLLVCQPHLADDILRAVRNFTSQ